MAIVKAYVGNFKGPKGDTGPAGPQGPQGPQGSQGPAGASPEIATEAQAGIVKAGDDISVGADGGMTVKTDFTAASELANIVADEALKIMLGKLAAWYPKVSNALQTTDLVSVQTDDATKVPSAALAYAMQQQLDQVNSDYIKITNVSATFTVGAGATAPAKVNHTTPTGYSIGAITFKMGSADVMSGCIGHYDDKSVTIWISSRHAAELTRPIDVLILYYRSE